MVKVRTLRAMLIGDTSHDAGAVADVPPDRAAELVGCDHAEWVDPPTPELEALEAEARAAHVVREGSAGESPPADRRRPDPRAQSWTFKG